jgi:hypothetical protein
MRRLRAKPHSRQFDFMCTPDRNNLAGDTVGAKLVRGLNVEDPGVPWAEC